MISMNNVRVQGQLGRRQLINTCPPVMCLNDGLKPALLAWPLPHRTAPWRRIVYRDTITLPPPKPAERAISAVTVSLV